MKRLLAISLVGGVLIAGAAYYRFTRLPARPIPLKQAEVFASRLRQEANLENPKPIARQTFELAELTAQFPPRFQNKNKAAVFQIACPPGLVQTGSLTFSRWPEQRLPAVLPQKDTTLEPRADVYGYETPDGKRTEWYVNFADENLFFVYGGGLLAQDELQVAEHPALAALREALIAKKIDAFTVAEARPTPVLVAGVPRRCRLLLNPDSAQGRPHGLYGNNFAEAEIEAVRKATVALDPPAISNIIAIAAPSGGSGEYEAAEIEFILATAYTGFRAAVLESQRMGGVGGGEVVIHTGFWGCGAFGGNRELMATLQILAASLAGVNRLVFHTFDAAGMERLEAARRVLTKITPGENTLAGLIERITARKYRWGVSDGN